MFRKNFIISAIVFLLLSIFVPTAAYASAPNSATLSTEVDAAADSETVSLEHSSNTQLKYAPINGFRMAYQDFGKVGSGQVILFIAGFGLTHDMWKSQAAYFARDYRVIVPDLQGYGRSTTLHNAGDTAVYSEFASDLAALLEHLKIKKVHVVGFSMGAMIALNFYEKYPNRVRDLVLSSVRMAADPGAPDFLLWFADQIVAGGQAVATGLLPLYFGPSVTETSPVWQDVKGMIEDCSITGLAVTARYLALRPSTEQVIKNLKVPTLLIAGEQDALNPAAPEHHQMILSLIPHNLGQLEVISGVGHMTNMEAPAVFNSSVAKFLKKHGQN